MMRRSWKQAERQTTRNTDGTYSKLNPCEVCGASAGADYYSDLRVDDGFQGLGLVLCGDCAGDLGELPFDEALDILKKAEQLKGGLPENRRKALGLK